MRLSGRVLATIASAANLPALLPPDVDPASGACARGFAKIAPSPGKGFGAFATLYMSPFYEIGRYEGEVLRGVSELHARYGVDGGDDFPDPEWHYQWSRARQERGVGTTGAYVVKVGSCPLSGHVIFVDAEDPAIASWTRFLNHSAKQPNLSMSSTVQPDGTPIVRFVVEREIRPGDELLFDYGGAYWEHDEPLDSDSYDDPRLYQPEDGSVR